MLYFILSNNTEVEVKEGSTIFDIQVDPTQCQVMWQLFSQENLKLVKLVIRNYGDDQLVDQKENLVVDNQISFKNKEDLECHFHLREKTEEELLREEVKILREQLAVHDGAIGDIATAVSDLAEATSIERGNV